MSEEALYTVQVRESGGDWEYIGTGGRVRDRLFAHRTDEATARMRADYIAAKYPDWRVQMADYRTGRVLPAGPEQAREGRAR